MDGLKNYREKIKGIEKLVDKMENGQLSVHELVELETLTRDLHERSIILKYKAFESKIEEENSETKEPESEKAVVEEETIELVEEVLEEAEELEEETSVLDFSMFDAPEEEPKSSEEPLELEITPDEEQSEPVVEKSNSSGDHLQLEITPDEDHDKQNVENTEPETNNEPVAQEEPIVVVKEKGSSFLDRLSILDNSIGSQIGGQKLDTLSGAFGINQRLLYINELFDGSGEAFSDAIKILDTQSGLDEASNKVEELAFKNSWNPEEEVVLEFLAIIKRRYA